MNEIYSWICYGHLSYRNYSKTKNLSEDFSLFVVNSSKFHGKYSLSNCLKTNEFMKLIIIDYFLGKFKLREPEGSYDEFSDSNNNDIDPDPPRAQKFKVPSINTTKADLFNEIAEEFQKDERYERC
jgi:hypothetical protein